MKATEILEFWFGDASSDLEIIERQSGLWWNKDADVDKKIRERFSESLENLIKGELDHWKNSAEGFLAMIILADQLSRNMYRNEAKAFAQDELALALAIEGIEKKMDVRLSLNQRTFFYMPFEHAESMEMQERSVTLFRQLQQQAPEDMKEKLSASVDYAIRHRDVIEQFGRFPHRNPILGRESTKEELAYLKQPGAGF